MYRTERTHSIFNWERLDDRIKAKEMVRTIEDKKRLLQLIMDRNPHLHYSWETADDYIGMFKSAAEDNAARMEEHMIDQLELRNTGWTFDPRAEYYNPYFNLTKEQFDVLCNEMNKLYK